MIEVHTLDRLLSNIVKLNSEPNSLHLVICGDMNANTSDNPDCVADESLNHTDFLPDEYCVDNYLKRCSQDKGRINNNGNMLLDLCKQSGMRILNDRCSGDKDGKFTYVRSKGSSVVDYVFTSQNMMSFVDHFGVNSPNILSDHCLIDPLCTSNSKWFTSECFDKRRTFYCKLNMYRRNNTAENRLNMIHARSQYTACLRKSSRFNFDKCQTKKLVDSRFKKAKMYWDMLNPVSTKE
mgnify:FL=1